MKGRKLSAIRAMALAAIVCMVVHFVSGWFAAVDEASQQGQAATWGGYLIQWTRDLFENLQSEFWQLAVQFAILAGVFKAIGVVSYEEDEEDLRHRLERMESKLNELTGRPAGDYGSHDSGD
ncbi:MAG TPA: DUF6766 family protein [Thermomicrobiales bacterium]|jgi:hypothetical protein|nr:DUF6766 family protein [Thermomicrobiales bacterium]